MAKVRKLLFPRKPCVKYVRGGVAVIGDENETARMLSACILTMENYGWDVRDLKAALMALKKNGGETDG